jgi:hypothetical protein
MTLQILETAMAVSIHEVDTTLMITFFRPNGMELLVVEKLTGIEGEYGGSIFRIDSTHANHAVNALTSEPMSCLPVKVSRERHARSKAVTLKINTFAAQATYFGLPVNAEESATQFMMEQIA